MRMNRGWGAVVWVAMTLSAPALARTQPHSSVGSVDYRIRTLLFQPDQVIRLQGWVGYHVDFEFEAGEAFVALGGGDLEGLTYGAYGNHWVLKPKAPAVRTNLTVFTTRRTYLIDYSVSARVPREFDDLVYSLRFTYPTSIGVTDSQRTNADLAQAASLRTQNKNYWFCGRNDLQPIAAWDDGVHTHLRFAPQAEMPAIFVRSEDKSESLLNYSIESGDIVIHRLARQFILRRGKLVGCIVNKGFIGAGDRLESGTVSPQVRRTVKGIAP